MRNATHNRISRGQHVDDQRPEGGARCEEDFMKRFVCRVAPRGTLRFCGFLLAAHALAAPLAYGGVNRWTTSGPFGVTATSLAIDPRNPDTVYAGDGQVVFKSRDGGLSWTTSLGADPGYGGPSGLAIDPLSSSNVYAATTNGVFKSIDAGGSWAAVGPSPPDARAYSLAIDPVTPSTVYAGTAGGLFKSTNGGSSWSGRLLAASIYNLAFSPQTPSTIFGADVDYSYSYYYYPYPSFVHKSTDAGATWSSISTSISITPGSLAVDPMNPSTLYAGNNWGGVYKSLDSASSWHQVGNLSEPVYAVVIDPRNPSTLYAGAVGGVFRSTDGGVNWSEFSTGLGSRLVASLAIDRTGTRLHAGTYYGVFDYQIFSGAALDLSVGTDNTAHLLFSDLENRLVIRNFDSSGNSTSDGSYGPYSGWYARAVADRSDGLTRVLWNNLDGTAALWLLGPTGNRTSYRYGPAAGWTAEDVSVDRDGTTHLLWTSTDGRTGLMSVTVSGALVNRATYGPFSGWLARSIANGADGLTRILWTKTDGTVGLSLTDAGHVVAAYRFAGASGWTARDVTVASDNQTRILVANTDGRMVLWSVDDSGAVTSSGTVYGPPVSGQTATRISAGTDGLTRVLWTSPDGTGSLWLMGLDNVFQSSVGFGPE
jgi:hypothetical protein